MSHYAATARRYAEQVIAGEIVACKWVRLACERFQRDLAAQADPSWPYALDESEKGDGHRVCKFAEMLPHVKGDWARRDVRGRVQLIKLEPWQVFILFNIFGWKKRADGKRRFVEATVYVPRKNGKALAIDTPILTADGWKHMGELAVGDYVFHPSGEPVRICAATEVMHDRECYRMGFSNGDSVVCDAEHQWLTSARVNMPGVRVGRAFGKMKRVRTAREVAETLRYGARNDINHSMDCPSPIQFPEKDLEFPPYTLGAWLGDGHSAGAQITFSREDLEIVNAIRGDGIPIRDLVREGWGKATTYSLSSGSRTQADRNASLGARLRKAGLRNNKHIPRAYFSASIQQRLALLQGLMDTDGTISKNGRVLSYTTTSKVLADGFCELISGLGIKHSLISQPMTCNGRSVPGLAYDIQFMAFRDELPVFRLKRKLDRMRLRSECEINPRSKTIQVESAERVSPVPVRCIQVESIDGMFLCGQKLTPTHNSMLAASIGWWMFAKDGEPGAEVYSGATTEKQAMEVFRPAKLMTNKLPAMKEQLGVTVRAKSMTREDGSKFEPVVGTPVDGSSPHCAIIDEYHEHKSTGLRDAMRTGQGARKQPLLFTISTAGFNLEGPCAAHWLDCHQLLQGAHQDDQHFAIIYSADDSENWANETEIRKANPNLGASLYLEKLLRDVENAKRDPIAQTTIKTKVLNLWVRSKVSLFNVDIWLKTKRDVKREEFAGKPFTCALDLAFRSDLASLATVYNLDGRYTVFGDHYHHAEFVHESEHGHYARWARDGWLHVNPGNTIDLSVIHARIRELHATGMLSALVYDPAHAQTIVQPLVEDGVVCVEMNAAAQTTGRMPEWIVEFDAAYKAGLIAHDGNPLTAWALGNCVGKPTRGGLVYLDKANAAAKIDPAVALIMAFGFSKSKPPPVTPPSISFF